MIFHSLAHWEKYTALEPSPHSHTSELPSSKSKTASMPCICFVCANACAVNARGADITLTCTEYRSDRNSFNRAYLFAHVRTHGIVQSPSIVASRGASPPLHTSIVRDATGPRRLADPKILVQHGSYNKQYHAEYKLLARDVPPHKMLLCLYLSERRSSRP